MAPTCPVVSPTPYLRTTSAASSAVTKRFDPDGGPSWRNRGERTGDWWMRFRSSAHFSRCDPWFEYAPIAPTRSYAGSWSLVLGRLTTVDDSATRSLVRS